MTDRGSGASCVACENIPLRVCEGVKLSWSSGELGRRLGSSRHQLAGGLQLAADESRAFKRRGVHRRLDNRTRFVLDYIWVLWSECEGSKDGLKRQIKPETIDGD